MATLTMSGSGPDQLWCAGPPEATRGRPSVDDIIAAAAGDVTFNERTWELLTEAPDGGWGLNGRAEHETYIWSLLDVPRSSKPGRARRLERSLEPVNVRARRVEGSSGSTETLSSAPSQSGIGVLARAIMSA